MVVCLSNLRQAAGSHLERQASSLLKLPPEVACNACLGRLSFWFLVRNRWFCGCLEFPFSAFYFLPSVFQFRFSAFGFLISSFSLFELHATTETPHGIPDRLAALPGHRRLRQPDWI